MEKSQSKMISILHLTYDLRDRYDKPPTPAVRNLIDASKRISIPNTIDLFRATKLASEKCVSLGGKSIQIDSFGLPLGFLLSCGLTRAYRKIEVAIQQKLIDIRKIDIIHAHKLTYEGYIGNLLSRHYEVPLWISLRQTDLFVLKYRPDLRYRYRGILSRCHTVFYIVPAIIKPMRKLLGERFFRSCVEEKLIFLPNIVERKVLNTSNRHEKKVLLTVLRMTKKVVIRKNLKKLLRGLYEIKIDRPVLNIIGDGDYLDKVKSWVIRFGLEKYVNFLGTMPNRELDQCFRDACAFVLPSHSETFGLVYAESLLNNTPIMYSLGTGFDGLFENVGVAVNPRSVLSIKNGLVDIVQRAEFYRSNIERLTERGGLKIFSSDSVMARYKNAIERI